jgi:GPI inositol-deacylase, winged helix domain
MLFRFLLAQLHLHMLSQQRSSNAVLIALKRLPSGLHEMYDEIMERIHKQSEIDISLARKVLGWITFAKAPSKVKTLQHAVAIAPDTNTLDDGDLTYMTDLISVCAGLVTIDEESDVVRLVHNTTQGYIEEQLIGVKVETPLGWAA